MIENLKAVLLNKLNDEVVEYNKIKEQYDQMAEKIKEDNSDFEYDQKKKDLKKEYGMKRFSKKAEYQQKLNEIEKEYEKNLKEFRDFYDKYNEVKKKLAKWNIYETKKKIDNIPNCKTLKDFRMSKDELIEVLDETGLSDSLSEEELKMLEKLR